MSAPPPPTDRETLADRHTAGKLMTPEQRELARHALGLPNDTRRSYRNRFFAGGRAPEWQAMVATGLAECGEPDTNGRQWFWLTPTGARIAREEGESLCPEDFPETRP